MATHATAADLPAHPKPWSPDENLMRQHLNQETDAEADDPEAVRVADEIDREPYIPGHGPAPARI